MLWSALRCLLLELNAGLYVWNFRQENRKVLAAMAGTASDLQVIIEHYPILEPLASELHVLYEVRHEIVHPATRPGPEADHTPAYLRTLRERGLLMSTRQETDYAWISQLQSHRLFRWAFETVADTVDVLLAHHDVPHEHMPIRDTYREYRTIDAA